ncbi:SDR family oxidoreductase [Proteobacteria bacterium 005FR1]|nr:SDR family oxidoreductase [Proteobacteria bacterium 005FR1]
MPITAVSGSASGIGAAICEQLRQEGHTVIGIDLAGADVEADLSTPAGRDAAVSAVLEKSGGVLDHLVLCAGLGVSAPSPGLIASVNYFGATALLEGLSPALEKGSQKSAVVIGSVASVQPGSDQSPIVERLLANDEAAAVAIANESGESMAAYGGSKYAITCFVRGKAIEWGKRGIRLNVVAPGAVETPLFEASKEHPKYGEATRNFVAPLGRNSKPAEIASAVRFLLSEQASFVHGTILFVDGGMDAMMRPKRF